MFSKAISFQKDPSCLLIYGNCRRIVSPSLSTDIPSLRAMTHDPEMYKDPMTFNPERFLGPNPEQDPREISFGFGRRYVVHAIVSPFSPLTDRLL